MKAAICYEFGKPLVIEEVDIEPPQKGEVKVKLAATAICHSDIHDIRGDLGGELPVLPGHECAGYIEEVGEGVTSVKPGDPVVVSLLYSCGSCRYCRTGRPHMCNTVFSLDKESRVRDKKGKYIRKTVKVGGFAEYVIVLESQVVKVPADMPLDRAALLACGVITGFGAVVNRVKAEVLSSCVIIGTGGVGLNAVQGAAISGAYPVIAVDVSDEKLKAARTFGATHTINASQKDPVEGVRELTDGVGADYIFVTVGSVNAILQGINMSGPRGTTVIVGLTKFTETITFSPLFFIKDERVLTGGYMGSTNLQEDIPRLVELYKAGILKLDELITGRYSLEQINEAIEAVERGEALRNVIVFK
ncbi:MAG TPA: Zn-dependent alcohol dehydrogenase [Dehalococcoidales bacterium]|nr:Zn-dependent alcohol dehydrogenase [Dehalococcoidales bacterium]